MNLDDTGNETGAPAWMVTYGDTMSLLLTFFVMLTAMSQFRAPEGVDAAIGSLQRQFHAKPAKTAKAHAASPLPPLARPASNADTPTTSHWLRRVEHVVAFAADSAELPDAEKSKLRRTIDFLRAQPLTIEIRGHAAPLPLAAEAPYRDHWDLAYARAHAVNRFLLEAGFPAQRLFLAVAGATQPSLLVEDPELSTRNARVEISLLDFDERVAQSASNR